MIISTLPDPRKGSDNTNPGQSDNTILHAYTKDKYYYPSHATPYLFASKFINKGRYVVNKQPVSISKKCFYLLNPGDELTITFNDALPLQTLFIFFNEEFVNECFYSLNSSDEYLLEQPFDKCTDHLAIPSIPFHLNPAISKIISALIHGRINQQEIDANLFDLIAAFMPLNKYANHQLKKLNAIKKPQGKNYTNACSLQKNLWKIMQWKMG